MTSQSDELHQPIETVRYQFQGRGMTEVEVRPADRTFPMPFQLVVEAGVGDSAMEPVWKLMAIRGSDAGRLWTGTKRECLDYAYRLIANIIADRTGRCLVCDQPPLPRKKIRGYADGWVHQSCFGDAEKGSRWLKGLDAPARSVPGDQRSLLRVPEASGESGS